MEYRPLWPRGWGSRAGPEGGFQCTWACCLVVELGQFMFSSFFILKPLQTVLLLHGWCKMFQKSDYRLGQTVYSAETF